MIYERSEAMKVPLLLANGFQKEFESIILKSAIERAWVDRDANLSADRFINRSLAPHVERLNYIFNRKEEKNIDAYWNQGSNPKNLRLAYFLAYMPPNLFRTASVFSEIMQLGYQFPFDKFKGLELGAGPATGACGIAGGWALSPGIKPPSGNFALIEQDGEMLSMGETFSKAYFESLNIDWGVRTFKRKIDLNEGFLPRAAPRFNLWVSSYFLNEFHESEELIAQKLLESWESHLEDEGLVILVEPALKAESRKLLKIRSLLSQNKNYQILTPCIGNQICGAFSDPDDWCHEEVTWWRPPYLKKIEDIVKLDRKSLPFSYLVLTKSNRAIENILPRLKSKNFETRSRLVSPTHYIGHLKEFYLCTQNGKWRTRAKESVASDLERGDLLLDGTLRGDINSGAIDSFTLAPRLE